MRIKAKKEKEIRDKRFGI